MSNSLWPHGLYPNRLLCPWDSPGKNTGVNCHALLQGIFLTQELNPGLLCCRQSPALQMHSLPTEPPGKHWIGVSGFSKVQGEMEMLKIEWEENYNQHHRFSKGWKISRKSFGYRGLAGVAEQMACTCCWSPIWAKSGPEMQINPLPSLLSWWNKSVYCSKIIHYELNEYFCWQKRD